MNIAFITQRAVKPQAGGLERITSVIAEHLIKLNEHTCVNIFLKESSKDGLDTNVLSSIYVPYNTSFRQTLSEKLRSHNIDIIINQDVQFAVKEIAECIKENGLNVKTIFCHHVSPGAEISHLNLSYYLTFFKRQNSTVKNLLRLCMLPFEKIYLPTRLSNKYKDLYKYNDRVVLLSRRYIQPWLSIANIEDRHKLFAINNCLTYNSSIDECDIPKKRKEILIVSRLSENHKNISDAINIWKAVEKAKEFDDWKLIILGDGPDKEYYKRLIEKYGLRRVYLEGQRNPLEYYKRSSIYMMTSHLEGWPMTLGEAMQNGTVPIAFNSFGAAEEIIKDRFNGVLVPPFEIDEYYKLLTNLMRDERQRNQYASNAVNSSKRFQADVIIKQWEKLLEDLIQ